MYSTSFCAFVKELCYGVALLPLTSYQLYSDPLLPATTSIYYIYTQKFVKCFSFLIYAILSIAHFIRL